MAMDTSMRENLGWRDSHTVYPTSYSKGQSQREKLFATLATTHPASTLTIFMLGPTPIMRETKSSEKDTLPQTEHTACAGTK